jgi:hypothetical protein
MGNESSVDDLLRNFHLNPIHSQGFRCAQNGCLQVIGGGKVVVISLALALMAPWHSLRAEIDPCALVDEAALGPLGLTNRTTSKERKQEALPRPKTGSRTVDTCRSVAAGQELPTLVTVLGRPGKSGRPNPCTVSPRACLVCTPFRARCSDRRRTGLGSMSTAWPQCPMRKRGSAKKSLGSLRQITQGRPDPRRAA